MSKLGGNVGLLRDFRLVKGVSYVNESRAELKKGFGLVQRFTEVH